MFQKIKSKVKNVVLKMIVWSSPFVALRLIKFYYNPKQKLEEHASSLKEDKVGSENIKKVETKNILFSLHWFELSGAESYALETIKMAKEHGHKCFALSTVGSKNEEMPKFSQYCEEVFDYCLLNAPSEFKSFIASYIENRKIDVIHIHHSSAMYEALPYIKKLFPQIKIIDSTHIIEYRGGGFPTGSAYFSDYIDCHNVISKTLIHYIQSKYNERTGELIDKDKFSLSYLSSMCRNDDDFRRLESDKVRIAFYSRFALQKLPFLLEPVISELMKNSPGANIEVHVYGAGEYEAHLLNHLSKSKYSELFTFHGRCDNKSEVFKNADILFLPSLNEGITLTSYEALYHGVLPVSSNVGAQSELLPEECLIDLDSKFIKNAAKKISDLINDKEKYSMSLARCLDNLRAIEENEFNDSTIIEMYK